MTPGEAPRVGAVHQEWRYFLVALQFLTRIHVPALPGFEPLWLDRSAAYFPAVGLLVGAISALVLLVASLVWSAPICAVLAVAGGIALTGALHEDGLADTADGLGGGQTPEQRLAIMKDSRIGTYGACALVLVLLLKVACLGLMSPPEAAIALVVAHAGARVVPVVACARLRYVGDAEISKVPPPAPSRQRVHVAMVIGLLPCLLLPLEPGLTAILVGTIASAGLLGKATRLIGGYTGDVLGASEQVFETAVLLVLAGNWS